MKNHFRTAVLTVILAGGTLSAYATTYAMMSPQAEPMALMEGRSVRVAVSPQVAKRLLTGRSDVSVREACSTFETGARSRCMQDIAGDAKPVRVIDFAGSDAAAAR